MPRDAYQRGIYRRTGQVKSTVPMDCVFYLLLRDWIPAGRLGDIIEHARNCSRSDPQTFTDGNLARVAMRLRRRAS